MSEEKKKLVIITGLSGSGKSVALNALEDFGYYCIDNLPVSLLQAFALDLLKNRHPRYQRTALGIDARNGADDLREIASIIDTLQSNEVSCETLFLDTQDHILQRRYSETRRRHPLTDDDQSLEEAILRERELLQPLHRVANLYLDTSQSTLHQLRELIRQKVEQPSAGNMSLVVESFGFKHGTPVGMDFLFDARCLPNPHWQPELRPLTGRDKPVADFLSAEASVGKMVRQVTGFLEDWLPCFQQEGRSYLTIAIGCTGGWHRSVFIAESIARHFRTQGLAVLLKHRELSS